jgi:hypothetical protein
MYFCIKIVEKIGYRDKIIFLDFLTPQTIPKKLPSIPFRDSGELLADVSLFDQDAILLKISH